MATLASLFLERTPRREPERSEQALTGGRSRPSLMDMRNVAYSAILRISDPAPFGRPGSADSSFSLCMETTHHVRH